MMTSGTVRLVNENQSEDDHIVVTAAATMVSDGTAAMAQQLINIAFN